MINDVRLVSWRNLPLVFLFAMLFLDFYLARNGHSWTLLHYESTLPLISYALQGWRRTAQGFIISVLVSSTAVLYFIFNLSFNSLVKISWVVIAYTTLVLVLLSLSLSVFRSVLIGSIALTRFFILFLFLFVSDKYLYSDKLVSSYSPFFFAPAKHVSTAESHNKIFPKVQKLLKDGKGVILIVVESLGVPKNEKYLRKIKESYSDFVFSSAEHEGGATLAAEARYLCDYNGSIQNYENCLPKGANSFAVHGNTLSYFKRYDFYKSVGFKYFKGRAEIADLEMCDYSYNAICDKDLLLHLSSLVDKESCKGLFYMLTIDSHYPYSKYENGALGLLDDLNAILRFSREITNKHQSCHVLIVGDHPPPLSSDFQKNLVQVIEVK